MHRNEYGTDAAAAVVIVVVAAESAALNSLFVKWLYKSFVGFNNVLFEIFMTTASNRAKMYGIQYGVLSLQIENCRCREMDGKNTQKNG